MLSTTYHFYTQDHLKTYIQKKDKKKNKAKTTCEPIKTQIHIKALGYNILSK